jgi:hypothetical protein
MSIKPPFIIYKSSISKAIKKGVCFGVLISIPLLLYFFLICIKHSDYFLFIFKGEDMKTQVKITAIFMLFAAFAFIACGGSSGSNPSPGQAATPQITQLLYFSWSTEVTITCSTADAAIYYTLDNSEPDETSNVYSAPFSIDESVTVKAKAYKATLSASETATAVCRAFSYGWTKTMGGSSGDAGNAIARDSSGNIYITGYFADTVDFDPGTGTDNITAAGDQDIFITKISSDGTYAWTKTMGGSSSTGEGVAVTCDSSGNIYVTGYFWGGTVDFDPGTGTDNKTALGDDDLFITKINSNGSYAWTKTIGNSGADISVYGIACDSSGNIYITGTLYGTIDFDPGTGTDDKTAVGGTDIFITKIGNDGSYEWTRTMGGSNYESGKGIACDTSGNIYITGYFYGTVDFDPGTGTDSKTAVGFRDIFITKIGSNGSYEWTKTIGGSADDEGEGIACDSSGNIYITGYFADTVDFDPGTGTDDKTSAGNGDIFITKINSDGSYGWTKTMGGSADEIGNRIAFDSSGNIYVTGFFNDTVDFDPGTGTDNKISAGNSDIFITMINSDGSYGWTKTMGGSSYDEGEGIVLDSSGNIYITGYFADTVDFNPGTGTDNKTSAGFGDIFITKFAY